MRAQKQRDAVLVTGIFRNIKGISCSEISNNQDIRVTEYWIRCSGYSNAFNIIYNNIYFSPNQLFRRIIRTLE